MKNSPERVQFICDYIVSYERKIKELNLQGLFDSAKMFELFASNVGELYLELSKPLINLNFEKLNYPFVDLYSEDGNIFCQVSTTGNVPNKIKNTLTNINNSTDNRIKLIKEVYFIVLSNDSIKNVKDISIGNIIFTKEKNLITTADIIAKSKKDLKFQEKLFALLKIEDDWFKNDFRKYQEAIGFNRVAFLNAFDEHINNSYYIDLTRKIDEIASHNDKFVLIHGEAGSGKSVLCKKFLERKNNVLCARAEDLVQKGDVDLIWNFSVFSTLGYVNGDVYIYIDALEYIADNINKLYVFESLLELLTKLGNTHLICSCRSIDCGAFIKTIARYNIVKYQTDPISESVLADMVKAFPTLAKIINNSNYNSLLHNPFYINFMLKIDDFSSISDENQLRMKIWNEVICLNDDTIKPVIKEIVLDRAINFSLYSSIEKYDKSIINKLVSKGILYKTECGIRLKNDIFEDIFFEQYIDNFFDGVKGNYNSFFKELEKIGRCIYRRYQIWIENKLFSKDNREKFLYSLIFDGSIPSEWAKESIIGIVKSLYCKEFFAQYSLEIIDNNLLDKFIDITNLYAFEFNDISFSFGTFILKNKGAGREELIKIIYENEVFKNNPQKESSIKKLIIDYTNSMTNDDVSAYSFNILKFYIEKSLSDNYSYDLVKKEIIAIYKLHKVSDKWIKDFFVELNSIVANKEEERVDFAYDAIKDIISNDCLCLLKDYLNYIISFYDTYYTTKIVNNSPYYQHYQSINNNSLFGLNKHADDYDRESFNTNPKMQNIMYSLLVTDFWTTFKWFLDFINNCVDIFKISKTTESYEIYFSKDCIKTYFGTDDMWWTGENQNNMPTLLSDMTFLVKSQIIDIIKKLDDEKKRKFANLIKKVIYEKANNIIGLSIISNVGLTFPKELPGYCLELVSSLKIVLADLHRYGLTLDNPAKKTIENLIETKVGILGLSTEKYSSINPKNELRNYAIISQLNYYDARTKLFEIFDYLYLNIANNGEHALLYLQLKQMDIRNATFNEIDSNTLSITTNVDGEARKIVDEASEREKQAQIIYSRIGKINDLLKNNVITTDAIDELIKIASRLDGDPLFIQYHSVIIGCISLALTKLEIEKEKRDEYCSLWIDYALKQLNNETIVIDAKLYTSLFNQLNEDISDSNKNKIKSLLLELLLTNNKNDGSIYAIYQVARKFLLNDKKYGRIYLKTIFQLAEDEMNHQLYNYRYLRKHHKGKSDGFAPNMQPKLIGVDHYISQDGNKLYQSKSNKIIEEYLFRERGDGFFYSDIKKYDIGIVSHAFNCGLNLNEKLDKTFIIDYLIQLIDVFYKKTYNSHSIIDYYELLEVEEFFKNKLLEEETYTLILQILFENIDFHRFKRETVDFYLSILASMTAYYFDAYDSKIKRKHIEKTIDLMDKYISEIPVEWIRDELSKSLILGFSRFDGRGDWSKYPTDYSYSDKMFLNRIFSKYGYKHFYDLLIVINHLKYSKLLPEILSSLSVSFKKFIELHNYRNDDLGQVIAHINQIMYYAFVNFESVIRGDNQLIIAFEGILETLIELKYENAAVLLDYFRVH